MLDDGYKDGAVEKLGNHKPAGPYSGGKYTVQEGGTRTPFITRWPGKITPGEADQVVCTVDLAASFAAMTGAKVPADACLDSFNVLGALLGEPGAKGREHLIQQDNGQRGNFGFRAGDWKLQRAVPRGKKGKPKIALFNLAIDAGEQTNVIQEHPEVAKRMIKQLDQYIEAGRTRPAK